MTQEAKPIPPPRGWKQNRDDAGPAEPCPECRGVDSHRPGCVFMWAASVWYGEHDD